MSRIERLPTLDERAAALRAASTAADRRSLHGISQWLSWFFILGPGLAIWLSAYWIYVEPLANWAGLTIDSVLATVVNLLLAVSFAVAQAVLPPLLLSVAISNSSSQAVLAHIQRKVGWTGFVFATGVGIVLTFQSFSLLWTWWSVRPVFQDATNGLDARSFAVFSLIVLVGFPAWALNRLTPAQWVQETIIAREALKIKHLIDLEDAAGKAMVARVRGLLMVDAMSLTLEQRAQNNAEVAAVLAGSARSFNRSLRIIGATMDGLSGYATNLLLEEDQEIVKRFSLVARLLNDTHQHLEQTEVYAGALAGPSEPTLSDGWAGPAVERDALTHDRADRRRQEQRMAADEGRPAQPDDSLQEGERDALHAVRAKFGGEPFMRADVEELLRCAKSTAAELITSWKLAKVVVDVEGKPAYRYRIVAGGR